MQQELSTIFIENLAQTFFLPLGQSVVFEAMYWFGNATLAGAFMVLLGALGGSLANWGFGRMLASVRLRRKEYFSDMRFERFNRFFRQYGIWLLPLYWGNFGTLLVIAAGFFALRWWVTLAFIAAGTLLRFYWQFPGLLG